MCYREKEARSAAEAESAELRTANEDLVLDMASCRQKEAELLEFSATLTEKNVGLQSGLRCAEAKLEHLGNELSYLKRRIADLEAERSDVEAKTNKLREDLESERKTAAEARTIAAKGKQRLETHVMELEDEVKLLRKRNAAGIKALTRELETCTKKLEQSDEKSKKLGSPEKRKRRVVASDVSPSESNHSKASESGSLPVTLAPTQEMLVEKIVRLQQILARRKEKMEVLEEHRRHLVKELRKKTAIIQHYVLKDGDHHQGLSSEDSDRHKVSSISSLLQEIDAFFLRQIIMQSKS